MKRRRWILPLVLAALLVLTVGIAAVAVWWARTVVTTNEQNLANERGNVGRLHATVEYFHKALGAKTDECERLQAELERIRPGSRSLAVVDAWPVVQVVDGDTIRVRYEGQDEPVRLLCIDTPERGEPGFKEATEAMRGLVEGREVVLEFERPGEPERVVTEEFWPTCSQTT